MQNNIRTLTARDFEFVKCVTNKDWLGAIRLLSQFADGADGSALGVARWLEAWVRITMDTRQVHAAVALLQQALPLLDESPELQAQALPFGFYLAGLAHDAELCDDALARARHLLTDTSPAVNPWHGRLLYRMACHWTGAGRNLAKAEAALLECIEWHHRNVGPFGEHDRREQMGRSLAALAEVHLAQGKRTEAGARAREAQRFLDDDAHQYTLLHLQGLVAEANQRDAEALTTYQQGIAEARKASDWPAVAECAAACGRILRGLHEWDTLLDTLRPLVKDLIEAGFPSEAHRLQLLAVPSSEDVGTPQPSPTPDMLRLIAELVGAAHAHAGA